MRQRVPSSGICAKVKSTGCRKEGAVFVFYSTKFHRDSRSTGRFEPNMQCCFFSPGVSDETINFETTDGTGQRGAPDVLVVTASQKL